MDENHPDIHELDETKMVHSTQVFKRGRIGLAWVEEANGETHAVYSLSIFGAPSGSRIDADEEETVYVFQEPMDVANLMANLCGLLFDQRGVTDFKKATILTLERMKTVGSKSLADDNDGEDQLKEKARQDNATSD